MSKGLSRALDLRLSTERHVAEVDAVVRLFGGWKEMFDTLPPKDRARFVFRCIEWAYEAERREDEERRLEKVLEDDPVMRRDIEHMGIEAVCRRPETLEPHLPSIIARKPSILREALERRTVKALLTQWGYRRESDSK